MKLKSYLRGLGTGIFISAVLMGIAVSGKTRELSDSEIRTRAKALGMVEEDEVLVKPAKEPEGDKTVIKAEDKPEAGAEDKNGDTTGEKGGAPSTEQTKEEMQDPEEKKDSDTAIPDEEPAADDELKDEPKEEPVIEVDEETADDIRDSKEDLAMGGQGDKKSSNEKVSGLQNSSKELGYNEFFTIQIASGSSSETVSRLLKSGGAIDDAGKFDDYLCSNHYDKKITPGVFKIPVGADYKQIADIITGGN